jgi:hypothetical protein
MQEVRSPSLRSSTRSRAHFECSTADRACPSGHLRGSFTASLSAVGLLTCGGDEDARLPAPCWALVMCKRSRVQGKYRFPGLPARCAALQDHLLLRCQRGSVIAGTAAMMASVIAARPESAAECARLPRPWNDAMPQLPLLHVRVAVAGLRHRRRPGRMRWKPSAACGRGRCQRARSEHLL